MRRGVTDLNTESPELLDRATADLKELSKTTRVKISISDYETLPAGRTWLHESWSGDLIGGVLSYLPKGTKADVLSYWYQPEGGPIFNDVITVSAKAAKPLIAHRFLNYMLDNKVAYDNFAGYVGYQPPITAIGPDVLFKRGIVPPSLRQAVVTREAYATSNAYLALTAKGDQLWDKSWAEFRNG
jgi:spermidine/putrescine transport system substrate-binding protein